ncbi:MAG: Hsp33 family molecular chaperone HslO [Spirochaetia bacterium]|nr:Hsp33 family molecular chaperone HslO [Spirochaetia bacterium]MDD7269590.1 Hsp33 family molecular chaperone HslO [Treponema sp.]MDD7269601.1 Hsp33 family molecular chaperone HslO [Treponema sp.]MDY4985986.1 Hsp33 family molecular chaperone HslO [Treponema sp.]
MIKAEITDKELNEHLNSIEEDKMRIFTMADGRVRGALFHGTRFVNQIRAQHNLGILETYILGQASLCAALTIPMMKDLEHTVVKFETNGPAEGYSVEADSTGYVRGYLYNDHIPVTKALESWDLTPFLGAGNLTFSRVHKDDKFPQSSTIEADGANIAKDFADYFAQSEQINTAFHSSIQFDKQGRVIGAGSMYIQIMPKTGGTAGVGSQVDSHAEEDLEEEKLLQKVENAFKACPSIGLLFSEKEVDSEDIILGLFREFNPTITLKRDITYDCPCEKQNFLNYLRSLPKDQLEDIRVNGPDPIEIICRNCGSVYHIPVSEI